MEVPLHIGYLLDYKLLYITEFLAAHRGFKKSIFWLVLVVVFFFKWLGGFSGVVHFVSDRIKGKTWIHRISQPSLCCTVCPSLKIKATWSQLWPSGKWQSRNNQYTASSEASFTRSNLLVCLSSKKIKYFLILKSDFYFIAIPIQHSTRYFFECLSAKCAGDRRE